MREPASVVAALARVPSKCLRAKSVAGGTFVCSTPTENTPRKCSEIFQRAAATSGRNARRQRTAPTERRRGHAPALNHRAPDPTGITIVFMRQPSEMVSPARSVVEANPTIQEFPEWRLIAKTALSFQNSLGGACRDGGCKGTGCARKFRRLRRSPSLFRRLAEKPLAAPGKKADAEDDEP